MIEQRGKSWTARVRVRAPDPATGELRTIQRRIVLGHAPTLRTEAQAKLRLAQVIMVEQRRRPGRQPLFGPYAHRFIHRQVALMRPASRKQYGHIIQCYLLPALRARQLANCTADVFQDLLLALHARKLSRSTLENVRSVALQVMAQAQADGLHVPVINRRAVKLPKEAAPVKETASFTPQELERLFAVSPPAHAALYGLMALAGLRIGEALGVRRQDVNLGARVLHVRQSVVLGHVQALKTATSRADLPVSARLTELLSAHLENPDAHRGEQGLLFTREDGTPHRTESLRVTWLAKDLAAAGLPHVGFHSFRHSLPARLLGSGVSADVVRRLMRHSRLDMTQRYIHAEAEDLRAAIDRHT